MIDLVPPNWSDEGHHGHEDSAGPKLTPEKLNLTSPELSEFIVTAGTTYTTCSPENETLKMAEPDATPKMRY